MTHQVQPVLMAYPVMSQLIPSPNSPLVASTQPPIPVQTSPICTPTSQSYYPNFNLQFQNIQLCPTSSPLEPQVEGVTGPMPVPASQPIYFTAECPMGQAVPSLMSPSQEACSVSVPSPEYGPPQMAFVCPVLVHNQDDVQPTSTGQTSGEFVSYTNTGSVYYPPVCANCIPIQPPPWCYSYPAFFGGLPGSCLTQKKKKDNSIPSKYTKTLSERKKICGFCKSNRESREVYKSHLLKDDQGVVVCPVLRKYTCPLCQQTGDNAHTISYCPLTPPVA